MGSFLANKLIIEFINKIFYKQNYIIKFTY